MRTTSIASPDHLLLTIIWVVGNFVLLPAVYAHPVDAIVNQDAEQGDPLFDFESGTQGWQISSYARGYSRLSLSDEVSGQVHDGNSALRLDVNLTERRSSTEMLVDLAAHPLANLDLDNRSVNLDGRTITAWVWAPEGARGDPQNPNGLHIFVEDARGKRLYGTWQNIIENDWFQVNLLITDNAPACGEVTLGFDPTSIRKIGLNISLGSSLLVPIIGSIFLDSISIADTEALASDHLYTFDTPDENNNYPRWQTFVDWNAWALPQVTVQDGTLTGDVHFDTAQGDETRKGFLGLVYSPSLNLSDKGHAVFSLDIRFDPPAISPANNCPIVISLWAFDGSKGRWFRSDYQNIGSGDWAHVAFDLANPILYDPAATEIAGEQIDLTSIRQIGIQLWANADYQGSVLIDNIAVGGVAPILDHETPESFVNATGPHFELDGERFRFVGANAEYLFLVPDSVVDDVLDRAQGMGLNVIRTWGFSEGCESEDQQPCEVWSRYFQPSPGAYNESTFKHFDRVVAEAGKRGIRLIIPLANNWDEYGGMGQYVRWLEKYYSDQAMDRSARTPDQIHDQFYTNEQIKQWYRNYVRYFVTRVNTITGVRYADDPTIMAWELANEPRARSDPSGAMLHTWIVEMSNYLEELAPNQMVSTGQEGWYIMSKSDADHFQSWQNFPGNYWHYGVNWKDEDCGMSWGSNGADFLSDHSDAPRSVTWQEYVSSSEELPSQSEMRTGTPHVDYTTVHMYVAPGETNLANAPYCDYYGLNRLCALYDSSNHQAKAWLEQHISHAHDELRKPMILEEFGFHVIQDSKGSPDYPNDRSFYLMPDERARLFTQYLDLAYKLDIDGIMFWNLGYEGFLEQAWDEIPSLSDWKIVANTDAVLTPHQAQPPTGGENGVRLEYDPLLSYQQAAMIISNPYVSWLHAGRDRIAVDVYNAGDAEEVVFDITMDDGMTNTAGPFEMTSGWTSIILNSILWQQDAFSLPDCPQSQNERPLVTEVRVTILGYKTAGTAYFNFRSIFDNSYVLYPGDPAENVIQTAATRWNSDLPSRQQVLSFGKPMLTDGPEVSCGDEVEISKSLSLVINYHGTIEHPDGFFYHYLIDRPYQLDEQHFNSLITNEEKIELAFTPQIPGIHTVYFAADGEPLDGSTAITCVFKVMSKPPTIQIDDILIDGYPVEPPIENVLQLPFSFFRSQRTVRFRISGTDDFTGELQVGCNLKKEGLQLACGNNPLTLELNPGNYELRIWTQDGDSQISEQIYIHVKVPYPLSNPIIMVGLLFLALGFGVKFSRAKSTK